MHGLAEEVAPADRKELQEWTKATEGMKPKKSQTKIEKQLTTVMMNDGALHDPPRETVQNGQ
jgi:hypothetical protein